MSVFNAIQQPIMKIRLKLFTSISLNSCQGDFGTKMIVPTGTNGISY